MSSQVTRRPVARQAATRPGLLAALAARWQPLSLQGSRWLNAGLWLASGLALLVVVSGLNVLAKNWALETPIRRVQIAGDLVQTQRGELQSALERTVRGNFFTANLDELQVLAQRYPWVAQVRVSRLWPDQVRVTLSEKQALAHWGNDGLVSRAGEVFRPQRVIGLTQLPHLNGPRAQARFVLQQYQAMDRVLSRVGLHIESLQLTDRMSWLVMLEGGIEVLVDAQDTLAKLERFTVLYDRQLAADIGSIARIDLRYRNGVAIGWRQS
ncbi:MAG: cell division protein FtsQ/DivIB [Pseudomonadota bacterium]